MDVGKKNFLVFEVPPLAWMLIILCFSSIPGRYLPKIYSVHQAAHFFEYSVLGLLLIRGLAHLRNRFSVLKFSFLSVVLIVIFAFFDEWRQSFVPGRSSNLGTVFFDAAYAVFGVLLYDEAVFLFRRRKPKGLG